MSGTREENLFMAKTAEQCARFDDMAHYIRNVVMMGTGLNLEERNLLSAAYKGSLATRRQALRSIQAFEQSLADGQGQGLDNDQLEAVAEYRTSVTQDLSAKCQEVLEILGRYLVPQAEEGEPKVFYLKMKGDYYRYLAEFGVGNEKSMFSGEALAAYQAASAAAEGDLGPANPVRLGLTLNLSVFYHEIMASPKEACMIASKGMDEAGKVLSSLEEDQRGDAVAILQIISDNLRLWTSALTAEESRALEQDDTAVEDM